MFPHNFLLSPFSNFSLKGLHGVSLKPSFFQSAKFVDTSPIMFRITSTPITTHASRERFHSQPFTKNSYTTKLTCQWSTFLCNASSYLPSALQSHFSLARSGSLYTIQQSYCYTALYVLLLASFRRHHTHSVNINTIYIKNFQDEILYIPLDLYGHRHRFLYSTTWLRWRRGISTAKSLR